MTVVLFTAEFPFGWGEQFVENELRYLSTSFQRVLLVPGSAHGSPRPVPRNVAVDDSLAPRRKTLGFYLLSLLRSLRSAHFYSEIRSRPEILRSRYSLWLLVKCLNTAFKTRRWIFKKFKMGELDGKTIFYSYWLDGPVLGAVLAKEKFPGVKIVSRIHGGDLYEEETNWPYLPLRNQMIRGLDAIYADSAHGMSYFRNRYPRSNRLLKLSKLGVSDPNFTTRPSEDGGLRVVSCSSLGRGKRIPLLIGGLAALARLRPDRQIEWNHLGDGPLRAELESLARDAFPSNIRFLFHGLLENHRQIFEFYRANAIDVFLNASASEGIPVSIMEAQSCGIPVVAPAVGGIPEIVNAENGILLSPDPTPEEIARALETFMTMNEEVRQKRIQSKENWRRFYDAEKNYSEFVVGLSRL